VSRGAIRALQAAGAVLAVAVSGGLLYCAFRGEPGAKGEGSQGKDLFFFCGAGIRPPAVELAETFARENGVTVVTDYAGAEVLISKAKLSRCGDVYMPGDKGYVDLAAREGLILTQRPVCYFVPTILVQKDNPRKIGGLKGLVEPGVRIGLGDEKAVPVGRLSRTIFERNGIPWADVEKNLKFKSLTVNELGMQIQAGSLDAVIVWDAVARYYAKYGDEVPIPAGENVLSTVDAGVLKFTKNRELAEKFVDFMCSEQGRAVFRKHNYRVEPPG
jgi:molybdate transport system substrate-binding protein